VEAQGGSHISVAAMLQVGLEEVGSLLPIILHTSPNPRQTGLSRIKALVRR